MSETQNKQQYLRDNIIEQGYDAEEFAEFCEKLMGNIDIESWTYEQLQHIVTKYVESKQVGNHAEHESSFIDYQQEKEEKEDAVRAVISPGSRQESPNMKKKNDSESRDLRVEIAASTKPEMSVDELFKDPFSKTKSNVGASGWGTTSKVGGNQPVLAPSSGKNDFNFDDILGPSSSKPANQHSVAASEYQLKTPARAPAEVMRPIQPAHKMVQPQPYVKKPQVNMNLFDMNIDDQPQTYNARSSQIPQTDRLSQSQTAQSQAQIGQSQVRTTSQSMAIIPSTVSSTERSKSQKSKIQYQGQKVVTEDFHCVVPCAKAHERSLLAASGVQFTITGHQIVNRNFFVPDYVLFHVYTKGINVQVKRKYNHFIRLRNMMNKFYPGYRVAFLQKKTWITQTDKQFIGKQKTMIEFFMNDLLMNPQFRNCRIVEEFLTLDYKKLKAKLNEYDKLAKLKSLEDLCLLKGELNIAYTDNHRIYAENANPFILNMTHNLDKYKKLQDQLSHNYSNLIRTYSQIGQLLAVIESQCKGFNSSVSFGEFYEFEQTISSLNEIYKELSNSTKFDMRVLENDFKPIFRFQRDNIGTMKQILDVRNKLTEKFSFIREKITEPYVNNRKLDSFKMGVEQPSKHPVILKYQNGYFNSQLVSENMTMFKCISWKLNWKFANIAAMYEHKKMEEIGFWARKKGVIAPVAVAT